MYGTEDVCCPALQVFNVFNRVLGFFFRSSRIEFDDDWEEKSELAANGLRLLRWEFANVYAQHVNLVC